MSNDKSRRPAVEIIDERTRFTTVELCRSCGARKELIEEMVAEGIIEPAGTRQGEHWFPASSLKRTRITLSLRRDLGVNMAGAAVVLDLLERLEELESRLRAVQPAQQS